MLISFKAMREILMVQFVGVLISVQACHRVYNASELLTLTVRLYLNAKDGVGTLAHAQLIKAASSLE